jgi:hypothetical protein
MPDELDHLLRRLGEADHDGGVDLAPAVLSAIAGRREAARRSRTLAPVRAAAIGLAAAVGVAAGGLAGASTATESHQSSTLSAGAHLAPSTLLEGRG